MKTLNIKPNFSELSRIYKVDRRTIKRYNEGYSSKNTKVIRKSKLDKFKNEIKIAYGEEFDFLSDDYLIPEDRIDWVIMNHPYATIEPFMIRALDIAQKGVIMLGRIQILEGQGRFENVFQKHTPTDIYVYVDRIQCWKNGEKPTSSSS